MKVKTKDQKTEDKRGSDRFEKDLSISLSLLLSSGINGLFLTDRMRAQNETQEDKRLLLGSLMDFIESCEWKLQIARDVEKSIRSEFGTARLKERRST